MLHMQGRYFLIPICLLVLSACQTTTEKAASKAQEKKTPAELYISNIRNNGDQMLCSQPAYLKCFRQTRTRCVKDLSGLKEPCLNETLEKNGEQITDKNYKKFGNDFTLCMLVKHALLYPKKAEAIGQCLDKSRFENKPKI